jgi:ubiquitin-like modifier-activating enzyme ATG7
MPIVQFTPFSSLVQPSFWHELTNLKIDVLRLSDEAVSIHGTYSTGRSVRDRETGREIGLGCNLSVGSESFGDDQPGNVVKAHGLLKNFNTIEEFKDCNKTALFNQELDKIWESIIQKRDTSLLTHFFLITYADLKKYKYYYWFAFPALVSKPAWEITESGWKPATEQFSPSILTSIHSQLRNNSSPFFLVKTTGDAAEVLPLDKFADTDEECTVAFVDPSASPDSPGWPLRNVLAYLKALYPAKAHQVRVLCWRDAEIPAGEHASWKSTLGILSSVPSAESSDVTTRPSGVGWEKSNQGKLAPRMADLAPMMDPSRLAEQAVDLNLKLMRWRILPSLDLEKVSATKCLLLGAGTLGCYVARTLMGWGVRNITFVDSAKVSFSNPVRQPLFEFADCINGGKPKAACAAESLKRIYPGIVRNIVGSDVILCIC